MAYVENRNPRDGSNFSAARINAYIKVNEVSQTSSWIDTINKIFIMTTYCCTVLHQITSIVLAPQSIPSVQVYNTLHHPQVRSYQTVLSFSSFLNCCIQSFYINFACCSTPFSIVWLAAKFLFEITVNVLYLNSVFGFCSKFYLFFWRYSCFLFQ